MKFIRPEKISDLRLLYVDELKANRMIFSAVFEQMGINFKADADYESALQDAFINRYDLIIFAEHGGDMDAYLAAKFIRENERKESIVPSVIWVLTGAADAVTQTKAANVGIDAIIEKPMSLEKFNKAIVKYFGLSPFSEPIKSDGLNIDEHYLNVDVLDSLRSVLKDRYNMTLDLFKKDITHFIDDAYSALDVKDMKRVHHAMHTIKSASIQLGLIKVHELAAKLEGVCYKDDHTADNENICCDLLRAQVDHIHHVFSLSEPLLEKTKS